MGDGNTPADEREITVNRQPIAALVGTTKVFDKSFELFSSCLISIRVSAKLSLESEVIMF